MFMLIEKLYIAISRDTSVLQQLFVSLINAVALFCFIIFQLFLIIDIILLEKRFDSSESCMTFSHAEFPLRRYYFRITAEKKKDYI